MSFFRRQEERLARRVLEWQYEKQGATHPGDDRLDQKASEIVDEAHRIARERGSNIAQILRELAADIIKK